jgi:SAM-dependent methyltransferase
VENPPGTTGYYRHSRHWLGRRLFATLSLRARRRMFARFISVFSPTSGDRVLDVGVTGDQDFRESNVFEALYPYPRRLVALGREELRAVRTKQPGICLVRGDGCYLPFKTRSFDIAVSHATVEHAGHRSAQAAFVGELLRVAGRCFVTTPNRWFPLELHTFVPLLHYLPAPLHRRILRRLGLRFYADEANLNLLTRSELRRLFPEDVTVKVEFSPLWTNLIAYAQRDHREGGPQ